ncbi:hypothetical protein PMI04_009235 [Sphingobium sp. AP49]|uniref:hypothetical protein n=1 Tax=Sphingobium sp. AP49 TaxID=1144307 RepID=UPI0012F65A6A|nr:hypothetical protein [Sphingobium sp. AP49]WHO40748.1 hypothetical protein PMI04_009235 [Sphingobium sp. AP49]
MTRYSSLNCPEYQYGWQCMFSLRAKRNGSAAIFQARQSITIWQAMRRRAKRGGNPLLSDYRSGQDDYRFLLYRNKLYIDRAFRLGMSAEEIERRGLFDALRHHQQFRSFRKIMKNQNLR